MLQPVRRSFSVVLSLALVVSQSSVTFTQPRKEIVNPAVRNVPLLTMWRNETLSAMSSAWLALKPLVPFQTAPTLNDLRANVPALPDPPNGNNVAPPIWYDDPKPLLLGNFAGYFTAMNSREEAAGIAGSKPLQTADPTAGSAVVGGISHNLDSKNFSFTAPILSLVGRAGINLSLSLTYNTKSWNLATGSTNAFNADKGFPAPGWRLGFGVIQGTNNGGSIGPYVNTITGKQSFLYIAPDGTRRELAYNTTTGLYESYDASWLDFNATTKVLRTTDGAIVTFAESSTLSGDYQFLPTQIKDRQGNFITIVYKSLLNNDRVMDYILDTVGRRIDFYYENNRLREIRQDRNGTLFKYAILDYTPVTVTTSLTDDPPLLNTQVYVPSRITYPTGHNLRFVYSAGVMNLVEKWVPGVVGQGSARRVAYTFFTPSLNPNTGARSDWAESWNGGVGVGTTYLYSSGYGYTYNNYGKHEHIEIQNPNGWIKIDHNFRLTAPGSGDNWPNWQTPHYKQLLNGMDANGNPEEAQKETEITWERDSGIAWPSNVRLKTTTIKSLDINQPLNILNLRATTLTYALQNGVQLPTQVDESDGFIGTIRRTLTTYLHYPTQRILGLPLEVSTYEGAGTKLVSRVTNNYDQSGGFTDTNNLALNYLLDETAAQVIQHDNTNYGIGFTPRGNLTSVTQSAVNSSGVVTGSRIVKRAGYDTNGNARWTADGAGNRAQVIYTDNFLNKPASVGNTQAYPYTAADPIGMRTGKQYDYWTGNVRKSFNLKPNSSVEEQATTTTYDFADRPFQTTAPTGTWIKTYFWDNLLYNTTLTKNDTVNSVDQVVFNFTRSDGAGRTIGKGNDHPSATAGKYSGQSFLFNTKGQASNQSNVTAMNASWVPIDEDATTGWLYQNYEYDMFGRTKQIVRPDGAIVSADYQGCGCAGASITTTDEAGRLLRSEDDAFGRLKKASELDLAGNVFNTAYYTYDALDRLTQIAVKYLENGPQTQTRTFTYDEYGRLQSETTPEAGTVSYAYNANDQIATKTDARGKVTTLSYNSRNLLTTVAYNDSTPGASYGYDEYGARTAMTDGQGTMSYVFDTNRRLQSETRTFTGLTGKFYKLTYAYTQGGQLKQVNYNAANSQSAIAPVAPHPAAVTPTAPATRLASGGFPVRGEGWLYKGNPFQALVQYSAKPVSVATTKAPTITSTVKHSTSAQMPRSISGYVRRSPALGNTPMSGVQVTLMRMGGTLPPSGGQTTTDANGYYAFNNLPNSTSSYYLVMPSLNGWSYTPNNPVFQMYQSYTQDFSGTPSSLTTSISGTVTDSSNQPISGVTMTLTGSQNQTTTTDANGNYSFSVNTTGNYTVTPSKSGWTFSNPNQLSFTDVVLPQTANFTGSQNPSPPPPNNGPQLFSYNVNYAYNSLGALTGVGTNLLGSDPNATTNVLSGISYNGFGAVKTLNYGNGRRLTLGYSSYRHQMFSMKVDNQNGTDVIINKTYQYETDPNSLILHDNDGRIKKITDLVDGNYTTTYVYDHFKRLQSATRAGVTTNYSYDAFGNLYPPGASFALNASGAPATNRISRISYGGGVQNFQYDAAGNMTGEGATTYQYDAAGRMVSVNGGSGGSYGFDGDGKRVTKTEGGVTVYYVESSVLGKTAFEMTSTGLYRAQVTDGHSMIVAVLAPDGQFYWIHANHLGTGYKLTGTTGVVVYRGEFDPHGNVLLETGSTTLTNRKFTGYERDASGQDYAQARMYTGNRGRFTSPDPAGLSAANLKIPQSLNRYAYVQNDPVNLVDTTGLFYGRPDGPNGYLCQIFDLFCITPYDDLPLLQPEPEPVQPQPQETPIEVCDITIRLKEVSGTAGYGFHAYVLVGSILDFNTPREYYRAGPSPTGDGSIYADHGQYVAGTVDWDTKKDIPLSVNVLPGACSDYEKAFQQVESEINGLRIKYTTFPGSAGYNDSDNSNAYVYTLLQRIGMPTDKIFNDLNKGRGLVDFFPGWGNNLINKYRTRRGRR